MNHLEFAALESAMADTPADRSFSAFVARAERLLGVADLDGDNSEAAKAAGTADGYSLDEASDAFDRGETAAKYAASVRANLAAQGRDPLNRFEDRREGGLA